MLFAMLRRGWKVLKGERDDDSGEKDDSGGAGRGGIC